MLTRGCNPVARAVVDLWHADERGDYDNKGFRYRGRTYTDEKGRYRFRTIVPALYPGRTRHYHVKVAAGGKLLLTTQLYFPDEPGNRRDGLFRKELLMRRRQGRRQGQRHGGAVRFRHRFADVSGASMATKSRPRIHGASRKPESEQHQRKAVSGVVGPVPPRRARARLAAGGSRPVHRRWSASPAAAWCRPRSSRASSASG